jgi:chemotaxis response regulator CheB
LAQRSSKKKSSMKTIESTDFMVDKPEGFLIVGLGASAGGIQALQEFFRHVPEGSPIAYVVILHLSPDHDSQLAQALQAASHLPVRQVTKKVAIAPGHIYVVSPSQHLVMEANAIVPSPTLHVEERRAPVDIFFRTLADTYGARAVCVVLSGTGANGSMGLKRIKERGGVAYVQNPREAEFSEMPRNAIATELVDEVLPVAFWRIAIAWARVNYWCRPSGPSSSNRRCARYLPTCACVRAMTFPITNRLRCCGALSGAAACAACLTC